MACRHAGKVSFLQGSTGWVGFNVGGRVRSGSWGSRTGKPPDVKKKVGDNEVPGWRE